MGSTNSTITRVMVYSDRAQVTRTMRVTLDAGEQSLLFDDLPESIDQNSIQAEGFAQAEGGTVLREIKFRTVPMAEATRVDVRALLADQQRLEDLLIDIDDRISHANSEKSVLDSIVKKLTQPVAGVSPASPASGAPAPEMDPERWIRMVDFYRTKLDTLDREIRTQERARRVHADELGRIERELEQSGGVDERTKNQILVLLEMKQKGELSLDVSYVVYGPSWYPSYDLRVLSERKVISIGYNAQVEQSTGEDWNGVKVGLSTAQPAINGQQPQLSPWHINFSRPVLAAARSRSVDMSKKIADSADEDESVLYERMDNGLGAGAAPQASAVERYEADVESNLTSMVFTVNGDNSIPSDNLPHKLTIMLRELPVEFRYSTIPKLAPYAYLRAKTKNDTEVPLLPGPANVFLDNSYVANSQLEFVSPSQEFWTSLGIDEGMKIEYKLLNRFHKDEGVFSKRSRMVYEYQISITNNKTTKEPIVVGDQIPISGDAEIVVTLLDPELKKETTNPEKNENGFLEWHYEPEPKETIKIPLKFQVEHPRERSIVGI
ncbi:MAG TPA: mucoidy inhibitor MuiA family protein [Spirochaetia bacterium]|nr:mucoidy inhibitor MuiA family protein [Spirochaetia bacterium]